MTGVESGREANARGEKGREFGTDARLWPRLPGQWDTQQAGDRRGRFHRVSGTQRPWLCALGLK